MRKSYPLSFQMYSARDSVGGGPYVVEVEYALRGIRADAAANRR